MLSSLDKTKWDVRTPLCCHCSALKPFSDILPLQVPMFGELSLRGLLREVVFSWSWKTIIGSASHWADNSVVKAVEPRCPPRHLHTIDLSLITYLAALFTFHAAWETKHLQDIGIDGGQDDFFFVVCLFTFCVDSWQDGSVLTTPGNTVSCLQLRSMVVYSNHRRHSNCHRL